VSQSAAAPRAALHAAPRAVPQDGTPPPLSVAGVPDRGSVGRGVLKGVSELDTYVRLLFLEAVQLCHATRALICFVAGVPSLVSQLKFIRGSSCMPWSSSCTSG